MWSLIVVILSCGLVCSPSDQKTVVVTDTREQCDEARTALLKIPGYLPNYVLCMPGKGQLP
jgi:hypothetical protein